MGNGHATEKSGLAEPPPPILDVADASVVSLLSEAIARLDAEMESAPCNQTDAARAYVKTALAVLDARDKDRANAMKG